MFIWFLSYLFYIFMFYVLYVISNLSVVDVIFISSKSFRSLSKLRGSAWPGSAIFALSTTLDSAFPLRSFARSASAAPAAGTPLDDKSPRKTSWKSFQNALKMYWNVMSSLWGVARSRLRLHWATSASTLRHHRGALLGQDDSKTFQFLFFKSLSGAVPFVKDLFHIGATSFEKKRRKRKTFKQILDGFMVFDEFREVSRHLRGASRNVMHRPQWLVRRASVQRSRPWASALDHCLWCHPAVFGKQDRFKMILIDFKSYDKVTIILKV